MGATVKSLGIDRLALDEKLALVEEIWDTIAADTAALPLTEGQRVELERRLLDDDAAPDQTVGWDEVKAAALARLDR